MKKSIIITILVLLIFMLAFGGIIIYSNIEENKGTNNKEEAYALNDIQTLNEEFTQYQGEKKGIDVILMLQEIVTNNETRKDKSMNVAVEFSGFGNLPQPKLEDTTLENSSSIKAEDNYVISLKYKSVGIKGKGSTKEEIVDKLIITKK